MAYTCFYGISWRERFNWFNASNSRWYEVIQIVSGQYHAHSGREIDMRVQMRCTWEYAKKSPLINDGERKIRMLYRAGLSCVKISCSGEVPSAKLRPCCPRYQPYATHYKRHKASSDKRAALCPHHVKVQCRKRCITRTRPYGGAITGQLISKLGPVFARCIVIYYIIKHPFANEFLYLFDD